MSRNHSVPVVGRARSKDEMWEDDVRPGDFNICRSEDNLNFARILCECPCGCKAMMHLPLFITGTPKESAPKNFSGANWEWNGSIERPSLHPSIRDLSGCRFHGFLTDGTWTFCGDSGAGG